MVELIEYDYPPMILPAPFDMSFEEHHSPCQLPFRTSEHVNIDSRRHLIAVELFSVLTSLPVLTDQCSHFPPQQIINPKRH